MLEVSGLWSLRDDPPTALATVRVAVDGGAPYELLVPLVMRTDDDPADEVALADTVGVALQVVLDRLTPAERVAFVLHDSFGVEFATIAAMLDT